MFDSLSSKPKLVHSPVTDNDSADSTPFLERYSQFQAKKNEILFETQFKELENYLNQLLDQQNYNFSSGTDNEEKISMAKAKAKEYFKNMAGETFRHLRKTFGDQQLHFILPQTYINQVIENIKQELDYSLHHLTDQILEGISTDQDPTLNPNSYKIQKKAKKGKTKIPKKALTVLKNWLTDHFQDPYPSHEEKIRLADEAGITFKQVQNWFTNARGRIWRRTYNPEKFVSQIEGRLIEKDQERPPIFQNNNNNVYYNESIQPAYPSQSGYMLPRLYS